MRGLQMVDLQSQYQRIKPEIDAAIQKVLDHAWFIKGPELQEFETNLANYCGVNHAIGCANGTDALQIALMALGLKPGDEVIVPNFTFIATAEVISLLGLVPVMADVDYATFNLKTEGLELLLTEKTKAIVPVHLFGQCSDMESIMDFAKTHNLFVIEDCAQAIGSNYTFSDGTVKKAGTIGHIGTLSFFPSKNLGCYGDGGGLLCNDDVVANRIKMISNHGQGKQYYHDSIGVNSRLDTVQAAILNVKLPYLNGYCEARRAVADFYDNAFSGVELLTTPAMDPKVYHVYHQYTLKVGQNQRNDLKTFLMEHKIPAMIYYPVTLQNQLAFKDKAVFRTDLSNSDKLSTEVLSLPMHTELDMEQLGFITEAVLKFCK